MAEPFKSEKFDVGRVGLTESDLPPWESGPIELDRWFGPERRGKRFELEIGSGKGTFLVQQAALQPEVNFIGIEYAFSIWRYAADRVRRRGLADRVRLIYADAAFVIRNYFGDGVFGCIHLYFPDPWPKARHHKRRFVQEDNLRELERILAPDGRILIATDHADYFEWMNEKIAGVGDVLVPMPFTRPASAGEEELVGTNFERKYRREGRPFFSVALEKARR
ncbi:MAG: tRNA (guanosine(46)-N7)-methyltransferase TrmB [Phycisphaeraceae bacterium]|nr:tRNA (guanosine(46)-N7)-methyltransferase TrmB [Phycisphaeraceae bacterium]